MNPKITLKDRKILALLDDNPRLSTSQIAKKTRMSRQVVDYRIERLVQQRTIYHFYTLIDTGRLGYTNYRVHLRIKEVAEKRRRLFAKELYTDYATFWVGFVSGSFDIIMDLFAHNAFDFQRTLHSLIQAHPDIIESYETLVVTGLPLYQYGYFIDKKQDRRTTHLHRHLSHHVLSDDDARLLRLIKRDCRLPLTQLARKLNLSVPTIRHRISSLEEKGIIAGYQALVDFNHFGLHSYKIFVRYNSARLDQEEKLLEELRQTPGILNIVTFLGRWQMDIEIHKKGIRELQQFMISLRNRYDIIQDFEIDQIIEDFEIDFFPDKLLK